MMKTIQIVLLLSASLFLSGARSGNVPKPDARAEIVALDDAWIKAEVGRDKAALEEILDEQFLITYPSGRTADRATFIAGIMNGELKPFEVIHEEIRIHGNTAVVVDTVTEWKTRFIWVAVKKGEKWKVVSEVAIRIADSK